MVEPWNKNYEEFSREFLAEVMVYSNRGYSTLKPRLFLGRSEVTAHCQRGYGSVEARLRLSSGDVAPLFDARNTSLHENFRIKGC